MSCDFRQDMGGRGGREVGPGLSKGVESGGRKGERERWMERE